MADESLNNAGKTARQKKVDDGGATDDSRNAVLGGQGPGENAAGPAVFAEFDEGGSDNRNLDFLLDVPLEVSVEFGKTNMTIDRLLRLTRGSVVELDKVAGEPVEIYVNKKLMGKGEVVVVKERFGVRITEIISRAARVRNMG